MTNMSLTLSQAPDGTITGTYTAIGTAPLQFCPATPPCAITSAVTGVNTALQVFFYMQDAGNFTGQLVAPGKLKGALSRISATDAVEFTRP
jgi:hypothetical protein